MKIKDLINKLKTLDGDLDVFVDGYEGGFDLVTDITQEKLYRAEKEKWHSGTFHKDDTELKINKSNKFNGIVLFSNRRREDDED